MATKTSEFTPTDALQWLEQIGHATPHEDCGTCAMIEFVNHSSGRCPTIGQMIDVILGVKTKREAELVCKLFTFYNEYTRPNVAFALGEATGKKRERLLELYREPLQDLFYELGH